MDRLRRGRNMGALLTGSVAKSPAATLGRRIAVAFCTVGIAFVQVAPGPALSQAGLQTRFDWAGLDDATVITSEPILSPEVAAAMGLAILRYQGIVARGGWPSVPIDHELRLSTQHPSVALLRRRLIASDDLDSSAGISDVFDSYVDAAVRRFQARHGIPTDGIVGQTTFAALNVPAAVRLNQLTTNRDRLREMLVAVPARYVLVNLPGAQIEAVEGGRIVTRHTAVVGRSDRPSPVLTSQIFEVNFNPFWTIPTSIIRRDLIPLMQEEPNYLTEQRIRIYTQQGQEITPSDVDWFSDEATRYVFRQDPGDLNALGSVRINFNNEHAVYLHDTPDKTLFGNDYRFDSSGCVRVQGVRELVNWLLRDTDDWSRERIETAFNSGDRVNARIDDPVKLYLGYITAWTMESDIVHFRDDIYGLDGLGGNESL
ncbi:MAG: L,D-transpeptidase family protein [Alphaproteobacteria bacterium]